MKKYAVFGNPIEHSMSPLIHAYFAENLGIKLTYDAILGTVGKFEIEAKNFLKMGGKGFNVTLPFKQEAYLTIPHAHHYHLLILLLYFFLLHQSHQ